MIHWCLAIGVLFCGPQDDSKKVLEDFKAKMKYAKSLPEKALALRALGDVEPREACTAGAIARYLAAGAGDDARKVYDRAQKEMIGVLQGLSGEKYPTIKELAYWWQKRGASLKEESAKREKGPIGPSTGPLPPVLLVELLFKENMGQLTINSGASGGLYPQASMSGSKWTATAALNGGPAAVEWDKAGATGGVDLGGGAGVEPLKQLKSFTITGWVLCQDPKEE